MHPHAAVPPPSVPGMSRAAGRFDELVPGWLFVVRPPWVRALIAAVVGGATIVPLLVSDQSEELRLAPILVLALVSVAGVCGSWPILITAVIVIPIYWYLGVPPAHSFALHRFSDGVAIGGLAAMGVGLVVLTRTIERSVSNVRELDLERQLESLAEANERLRAEREASQVRAALELSVRLAELEGRSAVAHGALEALRLPVPPTSASIAVVDGTHLRVLGAKGAHPRSIEVLEQVDITATDWLQEALAGERAYVEDREQFAADQPDAGVLRLYPAGSWASCPSGPRGPSGLLSIHYLEPQHLSGFDVYFSLVAESLATALQRAAGDEQRIQYLAELERSFAERDRIARTLSTTLVPTRLPSLPGFRSAGWLIPASSDEVAGDFYDLFALPEGDWVAVLGDVCGKGAEAAAVTSLARYAAARHGVGRPRPGPHRRDGQQCADPRPERPVLHHGRRPPSPRLGHRRRHPGRSSAGATGPRRHRHPPGHLRRRPRVGYSGLPVRCVRTGARRRRGALLRRADRTGAPVG